MNPRNRFIALLVWLAIAIAVMKFFIRGTPPAPPPGAAVGKPVTAAPAAVPAQALAVLSYEDRLKGVPGKDWNNAPERAQRAALLIEWLGSDRASALRYLAASHYDDLWLPGLGKAIGKGVTTAELLEIANAAKNPGEAISAIGQYASPDVVNSLANLLGSVRPDAQGGTAGAIAGLLAGINLDRALAFANGQSDESVRSSAVGGIFDALRSGPNGESAIRSLFATLPSSIQNSDPVRFGYGNAIWGTDPVGALQTLEGIGSADMRRTALLVLSRETASSSPETAIAAIYASGISSQGIYNHVNPILQNWSAVDPQAAASFLATTQIIPSSDLPKYSPPAPASVKG